MIVTLSIILGLFFFSGIALLHIKFWSKQTDEIARLAYNEGYETAKSELFLKEIDKEEPKFNSWEEREEHFRKIREEMGLNKPIKCTAEHTDSRISGKLQSARRPLSCFIEGDQIVVHYKNDKIDLQVMHYMTVYEGKVLYQQLLAALIQTGEFSSQIISEEEKQEMVNAAIKVKNELC